jgi:hypothetical protein
MRGALVGLGHHPTICCKAGCISLSRRSQQLNPALPSKTNLRSTSHATPQAAVQERDFIIMSHRRSEQAIAGHAQVRAPRRSARPHICPTRAPAL